jgi:hypothetical protein
MFSLGAKPPRPFRRAIPDGIKITVTWKANC